MRVLHIIPSIAPVRGGPSIALRTIARALTDRGVTVHVATTDDNGQGRSRVPYGRPVVENGFTCWYFKRQSRFYTTSWPLYRWLSQHVADYDLIHIHALFSFASTAGAFWAHRRSIPYLVRPLGVLNSWGIKNRRPLLKRLSLSLIERRILEKAAAVHFTSALEMREASRVAPCSLGVVIPNPVDSFAAGHQKSSGAFVANHPELAGKRIVLFLSRVDRKKGLELLIDGFPKVRNALPDVALVVAGTGDREYLTQLRAQASHRGVADSISWVGFLEGEAKQSAFAAADVFVLPSYSENFGIAVVEALVNGLPVVVSDQVGIHDDVSQSGAGLVVKCRSGDVQSALIKVLESQSMRDQMSINARRLAATFSPLAVAEQLLGLYHKLAPSSSPVCGPVA